MKTCNWGFMASNQFQASGSDYGIAHGINDADGDWAYVEVMGSGSATLTYMGEEMGGTKFRFAAGNTCGCFHNCGASGTGSGRFELSGYGANYLAGDGWNLPSGGSYIGELIFNDGFTVDDPFLEGN